MDKKPPCKKCVCFFQYSISRTGRKAFDIDFIRLSADKLGFDGEGGRTRAFLLGAQEGTEEGCVCRRKCCRIFRQLALTPAIVPGQGQLRWPRGAQSAPLNTGKNPQNRASLVLRVFSCVLVVRELAWRLNQAGGNKFVLQFKLVRPLGVQRARSARKMIQWIIFSEGGL